MKGRCARLLPFVMLIGVACGGTPSTQGAGTGTPGSLVATTPSPSPSPTPSPTPPSPTCSPSGTKLEISALIVANGPKFTESCLAAPAGKDFTIAFHNGTIEPHNVTIAHEVLVDILFEGKVLTGLDITYKVKAIPGGTYVFYCKIHPAQMNGSFVVA